MFYTGCFKKNKESIRKAFRKILAYPMEPTTSPTTQLIRNIKFFRKGMTCRDWGANPGTRGLRSNMLLFGNDFDLFDRLGFKIEFSIYYYVLIS